MLIGPTLSLKELEEHMEAKKVSNEKEATKLTQEINMLENEINEATVYVTNEDGEREVNETYTKLKNEYNQKMEDYNNILSSTYFIDKKLEELEDLEIKTQGQFDKTKEKVTLTLNDCLLLGVEAD